jgi:hypothetical protein
MKLGNVESESGSISVDGKTVFVVVDNMTEVRIVKRGGSEEEVRMLRSSVGVEVGDCVDTGEEEVRS